MSAIPLAFEWSLPHGLCIGIDLPDPDGLPPAALATLHPEEAACAAALGPRRRRTWIGGRIALHAALDRLGIACGPILATPRGAPLLPAGVAGSLSHKDHLAVALVQRSDTEHLGIDIEPLRPVRAGIERQVLTAEELAAWSLLPPDRRWEDTLLRFCLKEAFYKAIDPILQRFVGFTEVSVALRPEGDATLLHPFPELRVEARWLKERDLIVATARACG